MANITRIDVITLFPEMFSALEHGVTSNPARQQQLQLHYWNPRDYSQQPNQRVDDRPFGGGPGMLLQIQPLVASLEAATSAAAQAFAATDAAAIAAKPAREPAASADTTDATSTTPPPKPQVILLAPCGTPTTQKMIGQLTQTSHLILIAGRYLGIDQRFIDHYVDACYAVGDFVVSGGELPAMMLIDAICRQLPAVLGNPASAQQDSFMHGLLDAPHYTRPAQHPLGDVPTVLTSGNHQAIAEWKHQQSLRKTCQQRPDMLQNAKLNTQ